MKEDIRYFLRDEGAPFEIIISGRSWCDGSYRIFRECSEFWVIEYISSGMGSIEINGKVYYPQKGDVYLLPSGSRHCYYSDAKEPWIKTFVNFRGAVADGLASAYHLKGIVLFPGVEQAVAERFFQIYAMMQNRNLEDAYVIFKTEILIHEIFHILGQKIKSSIGISDEMKKIKDYLETHVSVSVTIDELSALIYRSPDYLIRHFREEFGMTPYKYFIEKKMEAAKTMLRDTSLSVKEIGELVGYEDAHYFSNVFRKESGIPPLQYRKHQRGIQEKRSRIKEEDGYVRQNKTGN
ncbi:AraC family transcriptional regulator [Schaedlerella arabinosiphila]|uniref:AraC family transcriptional regulator n=1 Tax=Schaedlerella arabinosiphila TaxID=2044587 RepID=UPI00138FD16B|nr:AraC family transcriptional regulator [Schaedlerella arabinosiphila]MCI9632702.1 AraC family transcriptional regulator [Ruminococcus sp.]